MSGNNYFVTVTEAKILVSVTSLTLQRHQFFISYIAKVQRHKNVTVTWLPLPTVNDSVALVTSL